MMKILILYYSKTGHTLEAANATANGIRSAGAQVDVISVSDFQIETIANYLLPQNSVGFVIRPLPFGSW